MKKIFIIISLFSLSLSGTMYFSSDFGDDKYMTLGYNHPVKDFGSWSMAVGASYDLSSDDGEGSANATFMNLQLTPTGDDMEAEAIWKRDDLFRISPENVCNSA